MKAVAIVLLAGFAGGSAISPSAGRALEFCNSNNLPDSTRIEISVSTGEGSVGAGGGARHSATVTVKTSCGELRELADGKKPREGRMVQDQGENDAEH